MRSQRDRTNERTYFFILIGSHGDELRLLEDERFDRRPGYLDQIIRLDDVQTRLVPVHGVEYGLNDSESSCEQDCSLLSATGVVKSQT